jgi:adhesin transport system outer membrane protein
VRYAQDNYVQHRQVLDQIASRTAAGVGRRADLEQATGRLALAESNLLTEVANLHDVSARYLRVVGRPAPETMAPLGDLLVGNVVPATVQDALRDALNANAGLNAAMENVLADERQVEALRAPFRPRLDLRARASRDRSIDRFFVDGTSGDNVVELVMTYNLSRGGADEARLRRAAESVNEARDMREKVCRDVRQQLAIAYNDAKRLKEQLAFLDQHQMSTEKAREAFRQQFAIGQRTLLDLLDTENEYFQARRAYTSGVYEQILAVARTLTEMGRLTRTLDVTRESLPTPQELGQQRTGVDPAAICPPEAPAIAPIDKEAIFSAAMRAAGR